MTSAELYLVVVATLLLLGVVFLVYRQLRAQATGPSVEEIRALEARLEGALGRLQKVNEQLKQVNQSADQIEPTEGDPNGTT